MFGLVIFILGCVVWITGLVGWFVKRFDARWCLINCVGAVILNIGNLLIHLKL